MPDPNTLLQRLQKSLNVLEQRQAKYGINSPPDLIFEIEDHQTAIALTEQLTSGYLTETAWREQLQPLLVKIEGRQTTVNNYTYNYTYYAETPPAPDIDPDDDGLSDDLYPPARHVIGRQSEWAELTRLHQRLREEKHGGLVFVTGQAGYGRQALVRAFADQARQQGTPILALRFKELRRGTKRSETFWQDDPLIGPALETYGRRVQKFWPQACEIAQLSWQALVAQIAQLLEFTPSPADQNVADQPEALRKILRLASRRRQPLLLLENLDDAPSFWLDLLRYLALELGPALPCLMVVTATAPQVVMQLKLDQNDEEYLHLVKTLVKEARAEELWLDRIDVEAVEAYVGPAEPAIIEQLHYLTDGMPVLVESLWQEWLEYEAVIQDDHQRWVRNADEWPVYGNTRDFADELLHGCLTDDAPFSRTQVEMMLSYAALEGYTFTAQTIARLLDVPDKALQDFWDDYLLETDDTYGVMINVEAVPVAGTSRYVDLYQFSLPFLRHVWQQYALPQPDSGSLADILETVYYPDTNQIKPILIRLFEAAGQSSRADYYRHQHRLDSDIKTLMWQVNLLASLAGTPFEQYRLFDLRLELSWKLYETGYGGRMGFDQAKQALAIAEAWGDRLRQARAANLAGLNLDQTGDYEAARPYSERALAILEEVLGPKHPDTAASLNNLAGLLQAQGDYEAARPYSERALAIREEVLGPKHPDTATSLNNLAYLLQAQGDYEAARPYSERALAIREEVLGPKHPSTATSLNNLAYLLQAQGDYEAARPYSERALAILEEVLGPKHPDTATSLNNLAGLLQDQGDYEAARPYSERALAICGEVLGPKHPDTATSLNNLAVLLKAQGDYEAARPYYERALAILEEVLGPKHPDTATSLNNLAGLLQAQGDYEAARPYSERALAIREAVLGPKHPDTATSLNNLAYLLQAQGDYEAARPYYERALAILEEVLGPQHPDTAQSLNNLALLLQAQGDYAAARPYYERALAILEEVLGPKHPDTATSLNNLAALLEAQGDYEAARPYLERALAICEAVLGPDHPNTQTVRLNLEKVTVRGEGRQE